VYVAIAGEEVYRRSGLPLCAKMTYLQLIGKINSNKALIISAILF